MNGLGTPVRRSLALLLMAAAWVGGGLLWQWPAGVVVVGPMAALVLLIGDLIREQRRPHWLASVEHAVDLWSSANPRYSLDDPRVPVMLRRSLEALAEHAEQQGQRVQARVEEVTAPYAQDRALLHGLIDAREGAVIAATLDGRILLYNAAAQRLFNDDNALALGRSLFVIFRRWAVSHFVERMRASGRMVSGVLGSRRGVLYHAQVAPLGLESHEGLLLALAPLGTYSASRRELMRLVEPRRTRLANLQVALETLTDDDGGLETRTRRQLLTVARDESVELARSFAALSAHLERTNALPLDDISAADLLALLSARLTLPAPSAAPEATFWVRAEAALLAEACIAMMGWLQAREVASHGLRLQPQEDYAALELHWQGGQVAAEDLQQWLRQPLSHDPEPAPGDTVTRPPEADAADAQWTPEDLVEAQGGALWCEVHADGGQITILLAQAGAPEAPAAPRAALPARPEYFDFAMFSRTPDASLSAQPLARLALTVFDTETTGLNPTQGDEIISIGAIRVLNGRLIGQEVFETLVRTHRPIHPESQSIHGLHADMLRDAPGQAEAISRFLRFAGETVLLGHNVAFDMRFLDIAATQHGLALPQLTLDTLLLSSLVYPERDQHRLEDVATRLGVTVLGRHTSLGDALLTAEVFCRLLPLLELKGIRTLGEALDASRHSWYARLDY